MLNIIGDFIPIPITQTEVYIALAIVLLVPLAFYVLRSVGVFMLARRAKLKTAFLAFFPCLWIYPATRLSKEVRFFKSTLGKWAIAFVLIFTFTELLVLTYNFLIYFPLVGNYLCGREICLAADEAGVQELLRLGYTEYQAISGVYVNLATGATNGAFVYPYEFLTVGKWLHAISLLNNVLNIAVLVIELTVFFNLFRKYWPQHFILATILSMFGLFPVFVFVIRNKKPMSYIDYLRSRYQNTGSPYGPQGFYGPHGFYGPQGPYGQNPYNNPQNPNSNQNANGYTQNPFEEFESKENRQPEEPFSQFNSSDKDERN